MGEWERMGLNAWFDKACRVRIREATKPSWTIGPVASQYGEW